MAVVVPPVFLIVAAALVHLVLGRLVETEREQIGLLKAFGYGNMEAASPYLKMAGSGRAGRRADAGTVGRWLGAAITAVLAQYMRFPHLGAHFSWAAFAVAATISLHRRRGRFTVGCMPGR